MKFKINKNDNYTVVSNYHLRDKELSLKGKGLLTVMLSLPDTWDYSINGLVAILKEGETSVKATLKELKKLGYLVIIKKRDEMGYFTYEYNIYEYPQLDVNKMEEEAIEYLKEQNGPKIDMTAYIPQVDYPEVENPPVDYPEVENQGQININKSIIKELNTNKKTTTKGFDKILSVVSNKDLKQTYFDFIKMRKMIKAPMTDRALKQLINKVDKMASNDNDKIAILEQSILNCWKSVYPLKKDVQNTYKKKNNNTSFLDVVFTEEELKEMGAI